MVDLKDYGDFSTAWCPGCGNFSILKAVKQALVEMNLAPHEVIFVSGIGQAAKAPHYLRCNVFNGLHGRALAAATGIRLANPQARVFVESGDGCTYGEGGNHFLSALRRNVNVTMLAHDNMIYGLTKGQASPTTPEGRPTKAQPWGATAPAFNPVAVAVTMRAGFVARGFSGMTEHLVDLIKQAAAHPGFSLIDILQPCVSFNKINTFAWYKERCRPLGADYDPLDWEAAMRKAQEWGDAIPVGVIYKNDRPAFETHFPAQAAGPLARRQPDKAALRAIMSTYA